MIDRPVQSGSPNLSRAAQWLSQAGLARWIEPATAWATRFIGIEAWVDTPQIAPDRALLQLTRRWRQAWPPPPNAVIATALARLPFTYVHAKWPAWADTRGLGERWRPLHETFQQFAARYDTTELIVWEGTVPLVPPEHAEVFLLNALRSE